MAYPLAGHTNSYHTYSFDEALAGIAAAGYKGVELSAVPGWTEHVDVDDDPAAVRSKLDQPMTPGYCNVGVVVGLGAGVTGFAVGDRVVSNGSHAELVSVPRNLCAKIPGGVSDDQATFTVLGAIALQGPHHSAQ